MKHEIAELLPFYANGTLDAADRARVDAELATCADCTEELAQLNLLAGSLTGRAGAASPLPPHVLDATLARIAVPPAHAAATRIHTAWWGIPARYATAAAIVLCVGVAGAAAWRVHEADTAIPSNTEGIAGSESSRGAMIYRVTPAPDAPKLAQRHGIGLGALKAEDAVPASIAKPHRLAKTARLELLVRDVEASLKQAQAAIGRAGGELTALDDASPRTSGGVHAATLVVEVPPDRLDATLDALAALGTVQNRSIEAADVDAAIVDEEARLRNMRREESDLRRLMDRGGKVNEILTVQQNLSDVRGRIEQLDAQHQHDLHRVAASTITAVLTEDRPTGAPAKPGPTARIDGAWHAGLEALGDTVVGFISGLVWCVAYAPVPLGLIAATTILARALAPVVTRLLRARAGAV